MRTEAPSEKSYHRAIYQRDIGEGATKGGLVGAITGAGLKRLGHKAGPVAGAALGAALGAGYGHLKGQERILRDTTTQERQHMRAEARTKKSSVEKAIMQGFADGMAKEAALPVLATVGARAAPMLARATPMLANLGRSIVGGGMRMANAMGMGEMATNLVRKGIRSSPNFMRNVGIAGLGVGATGLAGAGYMAGRN
jgi:hypothetical protein